jgi:hypothetical protein
MPASPHLLFRHPLAGLQRQELLGAARRNLAGCCSSVARPVPFHFYPLCFATFCLSHGAAKWAAVAMPLLPWARDSAPHAAWRRSSVCPADSCPGRGRGRGQGDARSIFSFTRSQRRRGSPQAQSIWHDQKASSNWRNATGHGASWAAARDYESCSAGICGLQRGDSNGARRRKRQRRSPQGPTRAVWART